MRIISEILRPTKLHSILRRPFPTVLLLGVVPFGPPSVYSVAAFASASGNFASSGMSFLTLFDSESILVAYDGENDWLYADWRGVLTQELVKTSTEAVVACLEQMPCRKLLNDNSNVMAATWCFSDWVAQSAMPRCAAAGLQYVAWVLAPALDCRLYADQAVGLAKIPLTAAFDELIGAHQWLLHCEQWFPAQRYLGV